MTLDHRGELPDPRSERDGVAIIGMACLFPGAPDVDAYWRNILGAVDSITDPPAESWDTALYYDPDSVATDRVYCKRGGYLGPLATFDPLEHGTPPVAVGGEPDQWLALRVARDAMADAGCERLDEAVRRRTAVILGKGTYLNGGNSLAVQHSLIVPQTLEILKTLHPEYTDDDLEAIREALKAGLPDMGPETVPGLIPNITVGRIANRLDLMGPAYTVDAACASSLVAVQLALKDLRGGECDLALVGGSQVWMPVPTLSLFCQLGALSKRQQIRPFDKDADGTLLGEGIGMIVLKRLADAERDGDRIYAVIRGVGVASDGRGLGVMAPRLEGEELALQRAYAEAGFEPSTVGLIEAHGTGTPVGDITEVRALSRVFGPRQGRVPRCAVGSVKSMISHTIPAAGVAGLIKVALSLHHKVLPPTLNCEEPNPKLGLDRTPFYINTTTRPWIHGGVEPRRAGVNAFGFGGINSHAVLEEYRPRRTAAAPPAALSPSHGVAWDSEVCLFGAASRDLLLEEVRRWEARLESLAPDGGASHELVDVAYTLAHGLRRPADPAGCRLAVVATSLADLRQKLARASARLSDPACRRIRDVSGLYYAAEPLGREGTMAFLVPGEGAQYPNMLADLCLHLPEVRDCYDTFDRLFRKLGREHLPSDFIFPRPSLPPEERAWAEAQLWKIEGAIESVRVANLALARVLDRLGIRPDLIVGHSSGEYAALQSTGLLDLESEEDLTRVTRDLIRVHEEAFGEGVPATVLMALGTDRERAEAIARGAGGAHVAMDNCPHQVVLACEAEAADRVAAIASREGIVCEALPFDRPYHTPLFAPYAEKLRDWVDRLELATPRIPLYSCTTSAPFPDDPAGIRTLLVDHWVRPVEFRRTIEGLHDQGVRLFVEAGPRGNLTAFVEDTLRGRPFCAVPANVQRRSGIAQLNHLVGILASHGVDLDPSYLFEHRLPLRPLPDDPALDVRPAAPPHRIKLGTGFPPMSLPDELALRLRATAPRPLAEAHHEPEEAHHEPEGAPAPPEVPSPSVSFADAVGMIEAGGVGAGPGLPAIGDFLRTMGHFLEVQGQVVRDCLGAGPDGERAPTAMFPLLGEIVSREAGESLVARRRFDPSRDLYLLDHALGPVASDYDPELRGLIVMPLAMSLEILAEAATALVPGRIVIGLRDVRASRWIAFDDGPRTLEVSATLAPGDGPEDRVAVVLRNLSEEGSPSGSPRGPAVEATILLADAYPEPEGGALPTPDDARPSGLKPEALYTGAMFHGPRWRGVSSIERTAPGGVVAGLRVLPADDYFREGIEPHFVLDPATLDAAGQVVGFWTMEHLARGRVVFPIRLDTLDLYGPNRPAGESATCIGSIRLLDGQQIRSDIDVTDAEGRAWMRLGGWYDRRFDLPDHLEPLILPSGDADISEAWPEAVAGLPGPEFLACRRLSAVFPSDRGLWAKVWAHRVLDRAGLARFRRDRAPEGRQIARLAGRTAAKEAVRDLLWWHEGLDLRLADIEIRADGRGLLVADGAWRDLVGSRPAVSIARVDDLAFALAALTADPGEEAPRPGISACRVDERTLSRAALAFDEDELRLFEAMPASEAGCWMLRARCAKEAAGRSLGRSRADRVDAATILTLDSASGVARIRFDGLRDEGVVVFTGSDGELATAATLGHVAGGMEAGDGERFPARQGVAPDENRTREWQR